MTIKVKLLRQLDGQAEGAIVEYPDSDAKRLEGRGVVAFVSEKAAPAPLNKKAMAPHNKAITASSGKGS